MSFYIYTIHNILNNKIYVGKTNNIKNRWTRHRANAVSKNELVKMPIHHAIAKYGLDNFVFSIIQTFKNEVDCLQAETYWIKHFNSINRKLGYNLTKGGIGSSGFKLSQETKDKISKANSGTKRTESTKKVMSDKKKGFQNHFYGKTHSKETKIRNSGENSKSAKLKIREVIEIIDLFKHKIISQKQIAIIYGISQQQVSRIVNGKKWSNVLEIE